MEALVWLILFVVFVVIECVTMQMTTVWFAGGSLIAFFAALFHAGIRVQVVLFLAVSILLLLAFRPVVMRTINAHHVKTNVESFIGKEAIVTEAIDNTRGKGTAIIAGQEWTARSVNGSEIEAGCRVLIKEVSGVKLMVEKTE